MPTCGLFAGTNPGKLKLHRKVDAGENYVAARGPPAYAPQRSRVERERIRNRGTRIFGGSGREISAALLQEKLVRLETDLKKLCTGTLFLINDRVDIALAVGAADSCQEIVGAGKDYRHDRPHP